MENVRFRRVKVFRRVVPQYSTAKTNHPAAFVPNREHDPITETIVSAALLVIDQHPGIQQQCLVIAVITEAL